MGIIYHKVSTTFRSSIIYLDGSGAVTGNSDWTIQISKNGTGNQATTGVTITEVDATNNAGQYDIEVSTSGFVSATGVYELVVFDTSDPTVRFSQTIIVNATGLADGSTGAALFTASTNDGRVTDGTSPLSGATVFVRDPSGATRYELTTDASGLYSVYLDTNGTWTIYAQKSAYAQNSVTVTVSGGTATGPGTDLELTAITSGSSILASTLWAYARRQCHDRVGSKADQQIKEAVNEAIYKVACEHDWEWLRTTASLALVGDYNTGTISVTDESATVTLSGGTWPTWAASGIIEIAGQFYDVLTRDSGTQLTLDDTFIGTTASGLSYRLVQSDYSLATDILQFDRFYGGRSFITDAEQTDLITITEARETYTSSGTRPRYYCFVNNLVRIWPAPTDDHRLNYSYKRRPADLASAGDTVDFDPKHEMLLRRAIDYMLCLRFGTTSAEEDRDATRRAYDLALRDAKANDKSSIEPLRPMRSPLRRPRGRTGF